MAHIIFYEKPGCSGNRRQKEWLLAAGHTLEVIDLLGHGWTGPELRPFFGGKPANECFNPSAPEIRDGLLDPSTISDGEALEMMVGRPLLIKRPLMVIEGRRLQGFDTRLLETIISLDPVEGAEETVSAFRKSDLDSCAHSPQIPCTTKED